MFKKLLSKLPWKQLINFGVKQGMRYAREDVRFEAFAEMYDLFLRDMFIEVIDDPTSTVDEEIVEKLDNFIYEDDIEILPIAD